MKSLIRNIKNLLKSSYVGFLVKLIRNMKFATSTANSFSQFGEDKTLEKYINDGKGFYLDVGCGEPVRGSNTYLFYKKGFSGLLVDPLSRNIKLCRVLRRKDRSVQAFVGNKNDEVIFHELDPYEYSTSDESEALKLVKEKKARLVSKERIRTISLNDLHLTSDWQQPTILSIDCEYYDFEVLQSINLNTNPFSIICIEDFEELSMQNNSKIRPYLISLGYTKVDQCGPSSIYKRST